MDDRDYIFKWFVSHLASHPACFPPFEPFDSNPASFLVCRATVCPHYKACGAKYQTQKEKKLQRKKNWTEELWIIRAK